MDSLITIVLTSALVATVVGTAINAWLDSRKLRQTTRCDALKAAVALEGYALLCANKLSNHELAFISRGHAGSYLASVPELPKLSIVAGFLRPQKASIASRLMVFPQKVLEYEQVNSFFKDNKRSEEAIVVMFSHVAIIGLSAVELASDIRAAFDLPVRELAFAGEPLQQSLIDFTKNKKKRKITDEPIKS